MGGENSNGGGIDPVSAIANAAGSLFSAIGNIFTSGNQIDIEQKKVDQLNAQLKIEESKGENLVLIEALKLKQTQANANLLSAKSAQTGKNIKTILIGLVVALFGFFIFKIISKSEEKEDGLNGQNPGAYQGYQNQVPQYQQPSRL